MDWEPTQLEFMAAAIGRLIEPSGPAPEDWPKRIAEGVVQLVEAMPPEHAELFRKGLDSLINESWAIFGIAMPDMHGPQKDELLTRCYNEQTRGYWAQPPKEFLDQLGDLAEQAAGKLGDPQP